MQNHNEHLSNISLTWGHELPPVFSSEFLEPNKHEKQNTCLADRTSDIKARPFFRGMPLRLLPGIDTGLSHVESGAINSSIIPTIKIHEDNNVIDAQGHSYSLSSLLECMSVGQYKFIKRLGVAISESKQTAYVAKLSPTILFFYFHESEHSLIFDGGQAHELH